MLFEGARARRRTHGHAPQADHAAVHRTMRLVHTRVADLVCCSAWSSIALARAYPGVKIDAIDADTESIEGVRRPVPAACLSDQVRPVVQDASDLKVVRRCDLVTIFEALHDMNHPVEALRAARAMLPKTTAC